MTKAYIRILVEELRARIDKDAGYSMRTFARDMGVSVSSVSQILGSKQRPAPKLADRIVRALDLPEARKQEFFSSLQEAGMESRLEKRLAEVEFSTLTPPGKLLTKEAAVVLAVLSESGSELSREEINARLPRFTAVRMDWALEILLGAGLVERSGPTASWRAMPNLQLWAVPEPSSPHAASTVQS